MRNILIVAVFSAFGLGTANAAPPASNTLPGHTFGYCDIRVCMSRYGYGFITMDNVMETQKIVSDCDKKITDATGRGNSLETPLTESDVDDIRQEIPSCVAYTISSQRHVNLYGINISPNLLTLSLPRP